MRDAAHVSSAVMTADGRITEHEGALARRILIADAGLARYARAMLATEVTDVGFRWYTAARPIAVRLELRCEGERPDCVVSITTGDVLEGLTARELDVLTLLAAGLGNREIAMTLRASARTVSTHVEHILSKLDVRGRSGAAAIAIDRGLVRLPVPGGSSHLEHLSVGALEAAVRQRRHPDGSGASAMRKRRPYLIGGAFPLSGPARADGVQMRNGAALAIDQINSRGGVAGHPIELVPVDTDIFTSTGVVLGFERLAAADVDAILVGYVLNGADRALDAAADYGAPYLHATTSEAALARVRGDRRRYDRVFQVCPTETHYGTGFVRFLDELVAGGRWDPLDRRLMIVETAVDGGRMATGSTLAAAFDGGWAVDAVECVSALGAAWPGLVRRIHAVDPAAVLIADFVPSELAAFQRAFASDPTHALVYAVYAPSVPEFLELAGSAADGLVWSTVTGTYGDVFGSRFAGRYLRTFGRAPGRSHAGIAYDEVHLLAGAWAGLGSARDFDGVATHLRHGAYRGVNGGYHFDDAQGALSYPEMTRDPSLGQAHLVFQIQDGEHRILGPAPYAQASFRAPSWIPASRTA